MSKYLKQFSWVDWAAITLIIISVVALVYTFAYNAH
jgi:hypothetical protein